MSGLSTHLLDLARGAPAGGVPVRLELQSGGTWTELASAVSDTDGRVRSLLPEGTQLVAGVYRLTFELAVYFAAVGERAFFPEAAIVFEVFDATQHHHVPLLLSPYGYSTYRGS